MKRIILPFFLFLLNAYPLLAQKDPRNLCGDGRPPLQNPEEFAKKLTEKTHELIADRVGKETFEKWFQADYLYPHYYYNVYYNTTTQDYRVFVPLKIAGKRFDQEFPFSHVGLKEKFNIEKVFPNCRKKPAECECLTEAGALSFAQKELAGYLEVNGNGTFGYDTLEKSFVWYFNPQKLVSYPYGKSAQVTIDANNGKVLNSSRNDNVWMGRCLAPCTLIRAEKGAKPVSEILPGDRVWCRDINGSDVLLPVLAISQEPVMKGQRMDSLVFDNGDVLLVSSLHPDGNGKAVGMMKPGDTLGKRILVSTTQVMNRFSWTCDILTEGAGGGYYCGEIYLGSTMREEFRKAFISRE